MCSVLRSRLIETMPSTMKSVERALRLALSRGRSWSVMSGVEWRRRASSSFSSSSSPSADQEIDEDEEEEKEEELRPERLCCLWALHPTASPPTADANRA